LTLEEAQTRGKAVLSALRFGDAGYYFIYDVDGVTLAHPFKPEWIGQNKMDLEDVNGVRVLEELIEVVKSPAGEGAVVYHFQKPGSDVQLAKIGYSQLFKPWGWVVGTGAYVEDIAADVAVLRNATLVALLVAAGAMAAISFFLTRSVTGPLERLRLRLSSLAEKDTTSVVTDTENPSEIGEMARGLDVLREAMLHSEELEQRDVQRAADQAEVVAVLNQKLAALADGDLTCKIDTSFPGEFETTRSDFNAAVERITTLILLLKEGIHDISIESASLESSSQELSRRTETQAASLEETTAALNVLTDSVKETEGETRTASERAVSSKTLSETGQTVVSQTIKAMEDIENSSKEILGFITMIDDIAFQTNLLALNAGIEAARAGKSGRGFAVVAEEVRGLAVRASQAAKDINGLVSGANEQVENGATLAQDSGSALNQIGENIDELQRLIQTVADATTDQARGLGEVAAAANQLDEVTQRNAAMFEETSATTLRLRQSVEDLRRAAGQFRLPPAESWDQAGSEGVHAQA
jgi:methyl-accepting chemotaxis protein